LVDVLRHQLRILVVILQKGQSVNELNLETIDRRRFGRRLKFSSKM
jgi:hypothetical protein